MRKRVAMLLIFFLLFSNSIAWGAENKDIQVILDGKKIALNPAPQIVNENIKIPIVALSKVLGASIKIENNGQIVIEENGNILNLTINERTFKKNNRTLNMSEAVKAIGAEIYAPLDFIYEGFNYDIKWDGISRTVEISSIVTVDWYNIKKRVIYSKPEGYTDEQLEWALAANGITATLNAMRFDVLGGAPISKQYSESIKATLSTWWRIENRQDALEIMEWLKSEGHRTSYDELTAVVRQLSDQQFNALLEEIDSNDSMQVTLQFVRKYHKELDKKSLIGWDYARLIDVAQCCYIAGYISAEEAWAEIMDAAIIIQKTFDSWEELGKNYLLGRMFWSGEQTFEKDRESAMEWLLTSDKSPWRKLKWDLSLKKK